MSDETKIEVDWPSLITGMLDCIFAFGVLLAARGLIDREEFAGELDKMVAQQRRQGGGDLELESRTMLPRLLASLFKTPVVHGLQIIEGGKKIGGAPFASPDDDPAAA
jgi:hypothetical protein